MKNKENFLNTIIYICVALVIGSALGTIINTGITQETTVLVTVCWCISAAIWCLMWLQKFVELGNWKEWYYQLEEAYNKLSKQFDELCQTAKEVNDNNTKQNKLCDEVNKQNKELIESQQQILARCRELVDSLYDTRMELYKVDPTNPLLLELLEKYEELKEKEEQNKEQEKIDL